MGLLAFSRVLDSNLEGDVATKQIPFKFNPKYLFQFADQTKDAICFTCTSSNKAYQNISPLRVLALGLTFQILHFHGNSPF